MMSEQQVRHARLRTRWSAIGAAIAITLGAGGLSVAQAAVDSGDRPVTISITAERILDTRTGLGLAGRFADAAPRDVQVTGSVPVASGGSKVVVPADAVGVLVNVTVLKPTHDGFLSLRPGGAAGAPTTSTVNFVAGSITPNAATVDLNTGKIQIWVDTSSSAGAADVLLDIVGYTIDHTHDDRYYTETETNLAAAAAAADLATAIDNHLAGTTVRGAFNIDFTAAAAGNRGAAGISFGVELAAAPVVHLIDPGATPPAGCSGTTANPGADAGHLCVFQLQEANIGDSCIAQTASGYVCNQSAAFGTSLFVESAAAGRASSLGTWALGVPPIGMKASDLPDAGNASPGIPVPGSETTSN